MATIDEMADRDEAREARRTELVGIAAQIRVHMGRLNQIQRIETDVWQLWEAQKKLEEALLWISHAIVAV